MLVEWKTSYARNNSLTMNLSEDKDLDGH